MCNVYKYYFKIIKPLEKKYNFTCILYQIFKTPNLKKRKIYYNKILVSYYQILQKNHNLEKELENYSKM